MKAGIMGLVKAIKDTFLNGSSSDIGENPQDNPYYEAVCARIPVDIIDEKTVVEFRWIKNKEAKIKGAYAVFLHKGEQVPVLVSAPNSGSFSVGINIGFSKILYPSLKEELQRLKNEGLVSEKALLGYHGSTSQAILYRRSESSLSKGDVAKWQDLLRGNLQPLIDDFEALLPFVMRCFGE